MSTNMIPLLVNGKLWLFNSTGSEGNISKVGSDVSLAGNGESIAVVAHVVNSYGLL